MIEKSLDTKSGFKFRKDEENKVSPNNTPSTQSPVDISKIEEMSQIMDSNSIFSDLQAQKSIKTDFLNCNDLKSKNLIKKLEHYTEEDINNFYSEILVTYKEFSKAMNIHLQQVSHRKDRIEDKIAAPLLRGANHIHSDDESSTRNSHKTSSDSSRDNN